MTSNSSASLNRLASLVAITSLAALLSGCVVAPIGPRPVVVYRAPPVYVEPVPIVVVPAPQPYYGYPGYRGYYGYRGHRYWR